MTGYLSNIWGAISTAKTIYDSAEMVNTGVKKVESEYKNHKKNLDTEYKNNNPIKSIFVERPKKWYE